MTIERKVLNSQFHNAIRDAGHLKVKVLRCSNKVWFESMFIVVRDTLNYNVEVYENARKKKDVKSSEVTVT